MALNQTVERYIHESEQELRQLIRDLCAIPAPSHHEEARARFCLDWFVKNGAQGAYIDEALNVVCPWNVRTDNELLVFMAHTDTVFPDMEPTPFSEVDGRMYAPGVTDDTANLAVLMICARYVFRRERSNTTGVLFVANSCEEGLGNLKGCRRIMDAYGARVREFVTLDGSDLRKMIVNAVGSHRYRVEVHTEGGHSYGDFGKPNAIHALSTLIDDLYALEVPTEAGSKTTYNVGMISGGTSVNTIAQQAQMLYEYRSNSLNCLQKMEEMFRETLERHRSAGIDVRAEKIGDRPCSGEVESNARRALLERVGAAIESVTGQEPICIAGSTDANMPLSMGIPAVCIGVCSGGKCHTREEWLDVNSLRDGCRLFMELLSSWLEI